MVFTFRPSTRAHKKYDVFEHGRYVTSFGDKRYQQYHDKLGVYRHLDHHDAQRRANYYRRFGRQAVRGTAKYFSHKYLW